jgi:acyl-CoA dehydrogenase
MAAGPSSAKLFCSEMVSRVADRGVQIFGGLGYMRSTVVERMYRDSRLYRLYEGTSEIQKLIIARELLSAASPG